MSGQSIQASLGCESSRCLCCFTCFFRTPLICDRKAPNKELDEARATTNILAAQSAEVRSKTEPLLQRPTGCSKKV